MSQLIQEYQSQPVISFLLPTILFCNFLHRGYTGKYKRKKHLGINAQALDLLVGLTGLEPVTKGL